MGPVHEDRQPRGDNQDELQRAGRHESVQGSSLPIPPPGPLAIVAIRVEGAACWRADGTPIGVSGGLARPGIRFRPDANRRPG